MRRTMKAGEFHGARRETRCHAGLTFAETEYTAGHRLPEHAHAHPFFSLLLRGTFRERMDRGTRDCIPTSLVFYPEQEPHEERFGDEGGRAFHVELGSPWIGEMKERGMTYEPGSTETLGGPLNLLMTRLYAWLYWDGAGVGAEEIVVEMMSSLGRARHGRHEARRPPWLDRVRDLLHERCAEVVRVSELAEEAGVHPVHVGRVFRRYEGCTVGHYVRRLRIERACSALVDGSRTLSDIALDIGFSDQAHFTRRFKELTGLTPGRYRTVVTS